MSQLLEAALRYAGRGWHVFPLSPGSKKPLEGSSGVHEATTDEEQIRSWWDTHPTANIGLATGSVSGVLVVDVDAPGAEDGLDLPPTLWSRTAKGSHRYYACGEQVPNSASKLAPKVDTRGDGGYVVLPPSVVGGHQYRRGDDSPTVIADVPAWIIERLKQPSTIPSAVDESDAAGGTPWGKAVLEGELNRVLTATNGTRNDTLFRAAANVMGAVKTGNIDQTEAAQSLMKAALGSGLDRGEAAATIKSAYEKAEPRGPAPREETPSSGLPSTAKTPAPLVAVTQPTGRWYSLDDLDDLPDPKWIIPDVLPEGLTVIYGPPASGKTFTALDWCLTAASQGHRVLYGAGEGATGLRDRARAWRRKHPHLNPVGKFHVLTHGEFPRLLDPRSVDALVQGIDALPTPPALLVIDTLARTLGGTATDSDDQAIGRVVATLDALRSRYGMSSLVLHHTTKPVKGGGPPKERGSGALRGAADCMWRCDEWEGKRSLVNDKAKEWEEKDPLSFRLEKVGDSVVVTPSVAEGL